MLQLYSVNNGECLIWEKSKEDAELTFCELFETTEASAKEVDKDEIVSIMSKEFGEDTFYWKIGSDLKGNDKLTTVKKIANRFQD